MPVARARTAKEALERELVEAEVNATIKHILELLEMLASQPPAIAANPVTFNEYRHRLIRRIWNLYGECIRYGASTVQPD